MENQLFSLIPLIISIIIQVFILNRMKRNDEDHDKIIKLETKIENLEKIIK